MNAAKKRKKRAAKIGGEASTPSEADIRMLLNYYQNGRNDDAEKFAQSLTQKFPAHPFSWKILGSLLSKKSNYRKAVHANLQATKLSPKDAESHYNLGNTLRLMGKLDDAEKSYERAVALRPNFAEAHNNLGNTLRKLGKLEAAAVSFEKVIALKPGSAEAHCSLGNAFQGLGRFDAAEASFRKAIEMAPNFASAHNHLGSNFQELGKSEQAEANFRTAIELQPNFAQAYNNLGVSLQEQGKLENAEAAYNEAIALDPDFAEAHCNLGSTLYDLRKPEESEESYLKAITLKPGFARAHCNLGIMLQEQGRFEEAKASFTRAIEFEPSYVEAHRHLSSIKEFRVKDEHYQKMLKLYLDKDISDAERCQINFSLASACENLGDFKQAFTHYCEGNQLRKNSLSYDIRGDIELFEQLKSNYKRLKQHALGPGNLSSSKKSPKPIFIIGMPRSGTTLVEQIISCHPQVLGAGELPFAEQLGGSIASGLSIITLENLLNFRNQYLTKLQNLSTGKAFVTDKMPQNFRYVGLLSAVFPEAKIVHVRRDPAAVCWANFKQYFVSDNLGYSCDLNDIIQYYKLYTELMAFWKDAIPKRLYDIDYELLTVYQKDETSKLIEYLDLDWDERCLHPQNNKRSISTASYAQARGEVYQGSSQKWKLYKPFLDDALAHLDQQPIRRQ